MTLVEFSSCLQDKFEENVADIHKYDDEYSRGNRFGLFVFKKV